MSWDDFALLCRSQHGSTSEVGSVSNHMEDICVRMRACVSIYVCMSAYYSSVIAMVTRCHGDTSDTVMVARPTLSWWHVRRCHGDAFDIVMVTRSTLSWRHVWHRHGYFRHCHGYTLPFSARKSYSLYHMTQNAATYREYALFCQHPLRKCDFLLSISDNILVKLSFWMRSWQNKGQAMISLAFHCLTAFA